MSFFDIFLFPSCAGLSLNFGGTHCILKKNEFIIDDYSAILNEAHVTTGIHTRFQLKPYEHDKTKKDLVQ